MAVLGRATARHCLLVGIALVACLGWLQAQAQLDALGPYVAPILYGGMGNVLFQLAALLALAKTEQAPCVVGFYKHWNRAYHTFAPWGGHTPPAPGATLKDVFPQLLWVTFEPVVPNRRVFNRNAFRTELPDEFHPLPGKALYPSYIHGYFFNHRFWHHERAYILKMFEWHPALQQHGYRLYGDLLDPLLASAAGTRWKIPVSLHLRYGYSGEPAQNLLEDRRMPTLGFYQRVFEEMFDAREVRYLVFSDNPAKARSFMAEQATLYNFEWLLVDENVLVSLYIMSQCQHHVLTSSTLSFWGAYLDPRQPHGGKTVLHGSFFKDHGRAMVPAEYDWIVLE
ncbi:uncharacterized protein MONBRDRAFT_28212 [Monosiga brevicollis MX1]|uniref:L-Fucosyltransferase n=1 Tax=Monosiga brevicollis TaxID=81824 RepID=A9V7I7_MONBE|nr:uncharacterized protein MONBRDRAFT_28212 [Monosiga brevicollis MX1]EDQ86521.1 predicted protein [Monosiga brevicollis MX1]|eukprot:XP_001748634.1 hypothetical protein [Monosiga brevicollis MX1]